MKTLVIYSCDDSSPVWFIVEEDWSKFHNTAIGIANTDEEVIREGELMKLLYKNPDEVFELKYEVHKEQPPLEGYDQIVFISNIY